MPPPPEPRRAGDFSADEDGPIAWLGEADLVDDRSLPGGGVKMLATLVEANWALARGHNLKVTGEYLGSEPPRGSRCADSLEPCLYELTPVQFVQLARRRALPGRHTAARQRAYAACTSSSCTGFSERKPAHASKARAGRGARSFSCPVLGSVREARRPPPPAWRCSRTTCPPRSCPTSAATDGGKLRRPVPHLDRVLAQHGELAPGGGAVHLRCIRIVHPVELT